MKTNAVVGMVCAALAAFFAAGCASTHISGEWKNPEVEKAGPYSKIFLTAVTGEETVRRLVEDAFQSALSKHQVEGLQSYTILPGAGKPDQESLAAAVKASGADAALVIRMVKRETQVSVMPTYYGPSGYYPGYYHAWDNFYGPSSVYQYEIVTLEARLYDVAAEALVMAVSTETTDAGNVQKEIKKYAELISKHLVEKGFFPASLK